MEITISELQRQDDYKNYLRLLQQLTRINPDKISESDFLKHYDIIKKNPYHKIYIAKEIGEIIGTITVIIEPKFIHDLSFVGHIEDVVVDEKCRGNGIGRALINHAIDVCKSAGCYKIILDCSNNMVAYYQKCGFAKKENQMVLYL